MHNIDELIVPEVPNVLDGQELFVYTNSVGNIISITTAEINALFDD